MKFQPYRYLAMLIPRWLALVYFCNKQDYDGVTLEGSYTIFR